MLPCTEVNVKPLHGPVLNTLKVMSNASSHVVNSAQVNIYGFKPHTTLQSTDLQNVSKEKVYSELQDDL